MYAYDLALLLLPIALMADHKVVGELWVKDKPQIVIVLLLAATPLYVLLGLQTAVALMAVPVLSLLYLLVVACNVQRRQSVIHAMSEPANDAFR